MDHSSDFRPRRRRPTAAELYFPPEVVAAVRAEFRTGEAQVEQPVMLLGGCQLYRIVPLRPRKPAS